MNIAETYLIGLESITITQWWDATRNSEVLNCNRIYRLTHGGVPHIIYFANNHPSGARWRAIHISNILQALEQYSFLFTNMVECDIP